ncbi:cytochrome c [Xanthobacteraceae bacterium Astr-EGSB]|uniref:c-type cytochrome n=1 Tax=Astrobacterium formosum TaxID=3069710 RepID=UPI0027B02826|nr:cytochrome c [Xanthobacteraceae bacterium Astr-EGSB]
MKVPAGLALLCLLASCREESSPAVAHALGDAMEGRRVIERAGCAVCHDIPGVRGPRGVVGPSLAGFARRAYFAGALPNRPGLVAQFVRDAPALVPNTAMPDMPLDERQARDAAAYLQTLR